MNQEDLKRFSLLVEFTEDDRAELLDLLEPVPLLEGETLFDQNDQADGLYLVAEGRLRVSSEESGLLGFLVDGAAIGPISLIVVGVRQATVRAECDCVLYSLSRGSFRRLADDAPRTACRLAEAIVTDLASAVRSRLPEIEAVLADSADPDPA